VRIVGVLLVAAASASAQTTYTWQGGVGDWTQASLWSPAGVPGSGTGDGVVVPSGTVKLGAAPAHALSSIAVTTGGALVLVGAAWTLPVTGAVLVGAGADAGTLTFDDDESPEGFITLRCDTLQVAQPGVVSAMGTGYPGAPANSGLSGSGPGGGTGVMATSGNYGGGAGHAGYGCDVTGAAGAPYGDPFRPAVPGSGGGATLMSAAGGNGGGRVRVIASSRIAVDGVVTADGTLGYSGATSGSGSGSGGSIWLTTPVLAGSGTITAAGAGNICASGGRVLVDGLGSTAVPTTLHATGGATCCQTAAAGTVVVASAAGERTLILDGTAGTIPNETPLAALLVTHFEVRNSVALRMLGDGEVRVSQDLLVPAMASVWISPPGNVGGGSFIVRAGRVQIDGQIVTIGRGWWGAYQFAGGPAQAVAPMAGGTVGGSYGGLGTGAAMGSTYGAAASPVELGSGGTADVVLASGNYRGGNGGGHVRFFAATEVNVDGTVLSGGASPDPTCPACAGGAGGSIWITAPVVSGTGVLDATGANGGGGGRIAVYADQFTFSGALAVGSTAGIAGAGKPGSVVSPPSDSLISLDDPPEGFFADGTLGFSGFALPAGAQFVVFVDDDQHLGDGSDSPNNPDLTEPMRRQTASASPVTVSGLTASHTYYWNVVALGPDGGVLAGSALGSFVACAGMGCGGPPPDDAGLTLPDGGIVEAGAPRFASTPEGSASCGVAYTYSRDGRPQVVGAGPLHFSVEPPSGASLPGGLSVDADTGVLHWTPSAAQEGVQRFDLVVTGPGGTARQPLDVIVVCRDMMPTNVHCGCGEAFGLLPWLWLAIARVAQRRRCATRERRF
jgi:hypothetical protein